MDLSNLNLQQLRDQAYRVTPATLATKTTHGQWVPARHLMHISSIIASEIAKGGARITISVPPRHGKSELTSVHTPIWAFENWPKLNTILASYGSELSTDFSRRVRDTFTDEDMYGILNTRLDPNSRTVGKFHTSVGGACYAMGLSGAITGRGGHLLLVDDYLKNAEESLSAAQREKVFETFRSTVFTRLEPNASIIVVATRWHQSDLIGRIHSEWPGRWKRVDLPALALEDDPLGREVGEPLWPERYDREHLLEIKDVLGSYWFNALYQQKPMASMSSVDLSEALQIIDEDDLPHTNSLRFVRAWDLASSESSGDWSVGVLMAFHKDSGYFYIVDVVRFQKSPAGTEAMMQQVADMDGPGVPIEVEQEPGSSGVSYIEHIKTSVLRGYSVNAERPTGPIEVRASPLLSAVEAGRCKVVRANWNDPFIGELVAFPNDDHDDQIAAGAIAYRRLDRGRRGGATWGRGQSVVRSPETKRKKKKGYKTGVVW